VHSSFIRLPEGPAFPARAAVILDSFCRLLGHELVERSGDASLDAQRLFELPQGVLAHDLSQPPLLDWANLAAADAFDALPATLLGRPSADTTPADATADRQHLFEMLRRQGFVTGYCGTRVSLAGRRFAIHNVTVLALHDGLGNPAGHAAIIGSIGPETAP